MTDLELFAQRTGRAARRIRDDDLAHGRDPVWMTAEDSWKAFAQAVLRAPTDELRALFMDGWHGGENE